ncbi:MAG: hypothetical protein D9V47_02580 [Clostridia bacterium]|nr:MAG: hypothetical protein D9V47_02580 [Clostridia bacterium]
MPRCYAPAAVVAAFAHAAGLAAKAGFDVVELHGVCTDEYLDTGYHLEEILELAPILYQAGADLIDCTGAGAGPGAPEPWPGWQLPASRQVKERAGGPVMATGGLGVPELADFAVRSQHADLVAVGRAMLRHPYWALAAARRLGLEVDKLAPQPYARVF